MSNNRFDEKAGSWDEKPERRKLANAVAGAIGMLPINKHMTAMEFGCGTGLVGLQLAPQLGQLVAIDTSSGMIEVLQNKVATEPHDNVTPVQGDIVNKEIHETFDLIFTSMTLHHIDNIGPILIRLHQLLKTGGILAIADLDHEDGSFHTEDSGEKHHGFKRKDLESQLVEIGFNPPQFKTVHSISKKDKDGNEKDYDIFLAITNRG